MDTELRAIARDTNVDPSRLVGLALRSGLRSLSAELLHEVADAARAWKNREITRVMSARSDEFAAKGGCDACDGRGWIVAWDTMDSMSGAYADIGVCPRSPEAVVRGDGYATLHGATPEQLGTCTPVSRERTGQSRAVPKTYGGIRQDRVYGALGDFPLTEEERKELRPADEALEAVTAEVEARKVEIGRPVRVVRGFRVVKGKRKGRGKLPLGLEGEVEWKGETRYGEAIRVRVGEDAKEVVLTSLGNVEVVRD